MKITIYALCNTVTIRCMDCYGTGVLRDDGETNIYKGVTKGARKRKA